MRVLYDSKPLQTLLDDFIKITKVRISICDKNRTYMYSSPNPTSQFCKFARKANQVNAQCLACDRLAFKRALENSSEPYVYQCHLGLYEAILPIYDNATLLGYLMIGQIVCSDSPIDVLKRLKGYEQSIDSPSYTELIAEYNKLRVMSHDEIISTVNLMQACAMYIYLKTVLRIERAPLAERITAYVDNYYMNNLSVNTVCNALNSSRSTIYKTMHKEYNCSLTDYIDKVRLEKAAELLTHTQDKVMAIALRVGYPDYNYFSRRFKGKYGISPRGYRKTTICP